MKNQTLITTVVIIIGVVLLAVGYFVGFITEAEKVAPQLEKLEKTSKLIKMMQSVIITYISASGEVTNISDRTITLESEGESLVIPVSEEATIRMIIFPRPEEPVQAITPEEIEFEDIKIGDKVNIKVRILEDGGIEGTSLVVTHLPEITPSEITP